MGPRRELWFGEWKTYFLCHGLQILSSLLWYFKFYLLKPCKAKKRIKVVCDVGFYKSLQNGWVKCRDGELDPPIRCLRLQRMSRSSCLLENGILVKKEDSKSKYRPVCNNGFELFPEVDTVKCKNGKLSEELFCTSSGEVTTDASTTSSLEVGTTSLSGTSTSEAITSSSSIETTTEEVRPTDNTGCILANGYLAQIKASNKYTPTCYNGFTLNLPGLG